MNWKRSFLFMSSSERLAAVFVLIQRVLRRLRCHMLVLGLGVGITLTVRAVLREQYSQERRQIEAQARENRVRQVAAVWNAFQYTDISTKDLSENVLAKPALQGLLLTRIQRERLRIRLPDILSYLGNPTCDAYMRLKTNELHYKFVLTTDTEQFLQNGNPPVASEAETVTRALWHKVTNPHGDAGPGLTGICLERIRAAVTHTNSPGSFFSGAVAQGFTMAKAAIDPGFRYGMQTTGGGSSDEGPFLLLSFFAHANASTNAAPVYLSLYWSDEDQQWAPSRLFTDVLLNINLLF
ncbi:MAG TPA: hypothetical protein VN887_19875 [Candidatus Angelobacter sp.]|nr:hypothetical protein [Candidatus Angelobacter sp.]